MGKNQCKTKSAMTLNIMTLFESVIIQKRFIAHSQDLKLSERNFEYPLENEKIYQNSFFKIIKSNLFFVSFSRLNQNSDSFVVNIL